MERRDLLKFGLATPFVLTPGIAQSSGGGGGGGDITAHYKKWALIYSDGDDDDDDVEVENLYLGYKNHTFSTRLTNFNLIDDSKASGDQTATGALNGARRIGTVRGSYEPQFAAGLYTRANTIPNVRTARVLIQVIHQGMRYTLSGTIRFRPLNARRSRNLAPAQHLKSQPEFANLNLNGNRFIINPRRSRAGYRLRF